MPMYQYKAKDSQGILIQGELTAASSEAVATQLLSQSLIPLSVEIYRKQQDISSVLDVLMNRFKINTSDMVLFFRQMSVLTKSGVPVLNALQKLQETTGSEPLRIALKRVVADISGGKTMTVAFGNNPTVFAPIVVSILDAGENSGRLDLAFFELSRFFDMESKTKNRAKTATRYPLIVLFSIIAAIITINVMVIPAFANIFASFHTALPLPTRILIGFSDFMRHYWPVILIALGGGVIAIYSYLKTPAGAVRWGYLKIKIPIVGKIVERIILSRFARTFAMVMKAGVPLVKGIALASSALNNAYMENKISIMKEGIEHGETLSQSAAKTGLFNPLIIQMLSVGEETGEVDAMLLHVAAFYEEEVDFDLARLSTLLEPIILGVLGLMVGMLALGVFLPMWDMVNFVKH